MQMRNTILAMLVTLLVGCNSDTEPTPHSYSFIKDSKNNNVFLTRYDPIIPTLNIEGIEFKISEAWVEHPHYWNGADFVSCKNLDFVMTFEKTINNNIDFNDYTKDLTGGNSKIWFFLHDKEYTSDTLTIKYKDRKNSKMQKTFYLVKMQDK